MKNVRLRPHEEEPSVVPDDPHEQYSQFKRFA